MEQSKFIVNIKFVGVDDWNRPIFKSTTSKDYYGSVAKLFDFDSDPQCVIAYFKDHMDELEFFGTSFGCEPMGGLSANIELNIVE